MPTVSEKRAAFRKRHDTGFFIIPNAWDAGSAVRLTGLWFKAIASTSSGAAWVAGKEDSELSTAPPDMALANEPPHGAVVLRGPPDPCHTG